MRMRPIATIAATTALLLVGLTPATALDDPIDIRAELDLPNADFTEGPRVFEVTGVTAGAGPELTGANQIANPSEWCGDIVVDVDPVAETITVDSDEVCDFELATVRITGPGLGGLELVANDFGRDGAKGLDLTHTWDNSGVTLTWRTDTPGTSYRLNGSAVFSFASVFVDVVSDHAFFDQIQWLAHRGLGTGTVVDGNRYFYPAAATSRQAMAAFLFRYAGDPTWQPVAGTQTFSDVSTSHSFYREIEWMADQGLATGYADGTFGPATTVSRQAMAAFLYRVAGEPAAPAPTFPDIAADHTFAPAIGWLQDNAIAAGYPDGTFGPTKPTTRQAMATFLFRLDALD